MPVPTEDPPLAPELHAFLSGQGFRLSRPECSKLLARKEAQGVLDRVGGGRYRVAG